MIPFLDLRVEEEERRELLEAFDRVLARGRIVIGPEVDELEERVATRIGVKHAIGVGSGTDALVIALRALGIGPGDEVIVPVLSFIATANAVSLVGATPVFVDIGNDLNIDPDTIEVGPNTKAIMPVHWAGLVCDMKRVCAIANRRGLHVIEDASQAFGAKGAGTYGSIGCFSMNSMKTFASVGEAGMVVTDDPKLAETCRTLRYHGIVNKESCVALAQNSRLDTLQAAALLVRLKRLDEVIRRRRRIALYYNEWLKQFVDIPPESGVYYTYTIQSDNRDSLMRHLSENGIETKIQHRQIMPHHPLYLESKGSWVNAERLVRRILCLPVNEKIDWRQRMKVVDTVRAFHMAAAA